MKVRRYSYLSEGFLTATGYQELSAIVAKSLEEANTSSKGKSMFSRPSNLTEEELIFTFGMSDIKYKFEFIDQLFEYAIKEGIKISQLSDVKIYLSPLTNAKKKTYKRATDLYLVTADSVGDTGFIDSQGESTTVIQELFNKYFGVDKKPRINVEDKLNSESFKGMFKEDYELKLDKLVVEAIATLEEQPNRMSYKRSNVNKGELFFIVGSDTMRGRFQSFRDMAKDLKINGQFIDSVDNLKVYVVDDSRNPLLIIQEGYVKHKFDEIAEISVAELGASSELVELFEPHIKKDNYDTHGIDALSAFSDTNDDIEFPTDTGNRTLSISDNHEVDDYRGIKAVTQEFFETSTGAIAIQTGVLEGRKQYLLLTGDKAGYEVEVDLKPTTETKVIEALRGLAKQWK